MSDGSIRLVIGALIEKGGLTSSEAVECYRDLLLDGLKAADIAELYPKLIPMLPETFTFTLTPTFRFTTEVNPGDSAPGGE